MSKTQKHKILPVVLSFLLVICASVSHASSPPLPANDFIEIHILDKSGIEQNEQEKEFFERLNNRLVENGFDVSMKRSEFNPRTYLDSYYPEVEHVISDVLLSDASVFEANIYTQGYRTPHPVKGESSSNLLDNIEFYLLDEPVTFQRLENESHEDNEYPESDFASHLNKGITYFKNNDLDAAVEEFKAAARLEPTRAEPHFNLALCHKRYGNHEARKEHVEKGLSLDRENQPLKNEKALIYMSEGKYDAAIVILKSLLPERNERYQWNLANAYFQSQQPEQAKQILDDMLDFNGSNRQIQRLAETRLRELEQKEKALTSAAQALWISFTGLILLGVVALIALVIRSSGLSKITSKGLPAQDIVALRVQLSIAILSGLFSVLLLVLPKLLSGN